MTKQVTTNRLFLVGLSFHRTKGYKSSIKHFAQPLNYCIFSWI